MIAVGPHRRPQNNHIPAVALWSAERLTKAVLGFWYDFADTSTITHVANSADAVTDKSGRGYTATELTGANMPITNTRTHNGLNTLDFNGTTMRLTSNAGALFTGTDTPFEVYCICVPDIVTGTRAMWGFHNSASANDQHFDYNTTALPTNVRRDSSAASVTLSGGTVTAAAQLRSYVFTGTVGTSYLNGTSLFTGAQNVGALIFDKFMMGARNSTTPGLFFDGKLCEIIGIIGNLSTANRYRLEGYLAHKWATQASLPGGHLYLTKAPRN